MKIPDEIVSHIKDRSLIQDVITNFVKLKKEGKDLKGECPFCNEKKLTVSPSKQIYKCWHCEKGGNNAVTFIMEKENLEYPDALRWLADFYHIIIPDAEPIPSTSGKAAKSKKPDSPAGDSSPAKQKKTAKEEIIPVPSHTKQQPVVAISKSEFLRSTMRSIGLSSGRNQVNVKWMNRPAQSETLPLLSEDTKGNIEFLVYDIDGFIVTYQKQTKEGLQDLTYKVVRLKEPTINVKDGKMMKYIIPKGVGARPFFPPALLEKYALATPIDTLLLTEGYKKALAGWVNGLDIVGLTSISTYRDKETMQLHRDIIELIKRCNIKNVVLLYDGDCADISAKSFEEDKDISIRPKNFFSSAIGIKELLKDYLKDHEISLYFAHVNTASMEDHPKGLDDIYEAKRQLLYSENVTSQPSEPNRVCKGRLFFEAKSLAADILNADLLAFSRPGHYFTKINITFGVKKLEQHLALENVTGFYLRHQEIIKDRRFVYFGTQWKYNTEKGECDNIRPAESKNYVRIGDDYHEKVWVPNKYKMPELQLQRRSKTTITDDHGKDFLNHIQKYKTFCNVPDHTNYQEIISDCFNIYSRFEWEPEEGDYSMTLKFLQHIFEEHFELGLDYLQLLYQRPTQILPILCLVSKENNTGKTTFAKWLKHLFKNNMAIVGNADLANDFNAFWSNKLIICCDEAFIDKRVVVERIKSLSTTDRVTMNKKGVDQVEMDFFGKFIMLSNNEDNFIYATEEDIRYWVRKVRRPIEEILNLDRVLISEIPAFLHFLDTRPMHSKSESRMWFRPSLLETEALEKVRKNSKPTLEKEIRLKMQSMFEDFSENIIMMTLSDIKKEFFHARLDEKYLKETLVDRIKVDQYYDPEEADPSKKHYKTKRYSYPKWFPEFQGSQQTNKRIDIKCQGRPYVFLRPDFVPAERDATLMHDPEFLTMAEQVPEHYKREGMLDTSEYSPLRIDPSEQLPF